MPQKKAAKKDLRQNLKRQVRNKATMKKIKALRKKALGQVESKSYDQAMKLFLETQKTIDKGIKSGFIKKNTGSRLKSRLHSKINSIKSAK